MLEVCSTDPLEDCPTDPLEDFSSDPPEDPLDIHAFRGGDGAVAVEGCVYGEFKSDAFI